MKLKKDSIRPISEQDPLTLFHAAIKSPKTDKGYTQTLRLFMCNVMEEVLHGTFRGTAFLVLAAALVMALAAGAMLHAGEPGKLSCRTSQPTTLD